VRDFVSVWLKDCEICNAGLCKTVDALKEQGLSENASCKQMSEESEGLYSRNAIRSRYQWHTGKIKRLADNQQPDEIIERFFKKAKSLARLAEKIKKEPGFQDQKQEMLGAAATIMSVLTETREGVRWV
jgi:hypothetical protein